MSELPLIQIYDTKRYVIANLGKCLGFPLRICIVHIGLGTIYPERGRPGLVACPLEYRIMSRTSDLPVSRTPAASARVSTTASSRLACLVAGAFLLASLGCAAGGTLSREEALAQATNLSKLADQVNLAALDGLDALAPKGFASVKESLESAIASARAGRDTEAEKLAQEGFARLEQTREASRRTSELLREVLAQRQRAIAAGAPALLTTRFEELEGDLRDASVAVERDRQDVAKAAEPALLRGYSQLELDALKTDATELARGAIDTARSARADRDAPVTFKRATKELEIARGILDTDRTRTEQANVHARRAADFAARSQYLSELVQEFDRRDYDLEAVLLWYQDQLGELTAPLEQGVSYTRPNHEAIAEAKDRIAAAVLGRSEAERQLADASSRIALLERSSSASKAELESRLADLERTRLAEESRYARVSSLFTKAEAVVYRRGSDVLLTTYGFDFPVGESEIRSSNFPLLNKIASAIAEFDDPQIVVSGHTDATGNDESNQKLSEDRAKKVGEFLVQVARMGPDRVKTEGLGESKPVASNETPDGRAKNRRIEIMIVNRGDAVPGAVSAPPPSKP